MVGERTSHSTAMRPPADEISRVSRTPSHVPSSPPTTAPSKWLERGDSKFRWRFEHEVLAVEGDAAVIEGWTYYDPQPDDPRPDAYANVWLVRFAPDDRAREFVEWWVQEPREGD